MAMGSALLLLLFFVLEISGQTTTLNISSASSSVQFVGNWRSDLAIGFYEVSFKPRFSWNVFWDFFMKFLH